MFTEFVYPDDNEEDFLQIAEMLSFDSLVFIYKEKLSQKHIDKREELQKNTQIKIFLAAENTNGKLADYRIARSSDDGLTRKIIEQKKADIILGMEFHNEKDYMRQMNSGLNHIVAKLARENDVVFAFPFFDWLNLNENKKNLVLSRLMQNLRLCKKYQLKVMIRSFSNSKFGLRNKKDMLSFETIITKTGSM